MTGAQRREKMDMAIKEIAIPFLRELGFKGSYPHFRREKDGKLNLLTFQFSLYSSQFVVEISICLAEGFKNSSGVHFKPSECRVHYMGNRMRIGSGSDKNNCWFNFEKEPLFGDVYKTRAKEIIKNWHEAETWWAENTSV